MGALCTTSGQAASLLSILNIAKAGDHFISASTIYGGTVNLFAVTLKKFGIECTFVDAEASEEELHRAFRPNTKAVFGETIANPAIAVFDIEKFAGLAHAHGVPLIVDNTFATPVLCRPFEWGPTSLCTPPPSIWTATPCRWAACWWIPAISTGKTGDLKNSAPRMRATTA